MNDQEFYRQLSERLNKLGQAADSLRAALIATDDQCPYCWGVGKLSATDKYGQTYFSSEPCAACRGTGVKQPNDNHT